MDLNHILEKMVEIKASDLFIAVDRPPTFKCKGSLIELDSEVLGKQQVTEMLKSIMNEAQQAEFEQTKECQFAYYVPGLSRFRASVFMQKDLPGTVIRRIQSTIPSHKSIGIPDVLTDLIMYKRGLVIFVGATGAGKSTSLAALINYRNQNSSGHIITIEDPIEYIYPQLGCIVTQREVGIDTESYQVALKNVLRQSPDVILIGEVRDREAMQHAISFAETGHLCVCTLHANNASQALDRILHFFPEEMHRQLFLDLSLNLRGIVAQQLINSASGEQCFPVFEILINTPLAADLIRKADISGLKNLIKNSPEQGMQSFDQALFEMYTAGKIQYKDALSFAESRNEVRLMIKLAENASPFEVDGMQLAEPQ
jgi:twitching motility protein PilU